MSNATGVYLGEIIASAINSNSGNEKAENTFDSNKQQLRYIASDSTHAFMKKEILQGSKNVTFDAFKDLDKEQYNKPDSCKSKIIFVKEVLKNESIQFFRVPRLGSYVAVPFIHRSYLSSELL